MKKILLTLILSIISIFVFSQHKNIISVYSGFSYQSSYFSSGSYSSSERGFAIGSNYERMLKHNWSIGGVLNYSDLFSKSGNFGFDYYKNYHNILGLSFKASKYFGARFFGVISMGIEYQLFFYTNKHYHYQTDSFSYTKRFDYGYPIFAELGCGYWIKENFSVFTSIKLKYDLFNFIDKTYLYYNFNVLIGIKYRF
ncbi:MAG: hypothetical protein LBV69_00980 [Bacteroidales bacterium]|jgi:hypothetical protein|nr:hypothetical protein [Bacteroidales bacterium]